MVEIRTVVIVSFTPVRSDAGIHGKVIGNIYGNYQPFQCEVDYSKLHEGWVPMIDPPVWKNTGLQGWVEWSHCVEGVQNPTEIHILTTVYTDGRQPVSRIVP